MPVTDGMNPGTDIYSEQGGNKMDVLSGGTLEIDTGGKLMVNGVDMTNKVAHGVVSGTHTVTSGEGTAHSCTIATGLTTIVVPMVQVLRANKIIGVDATITFSAGNLTVASGSTYVMAAGDIVNWMVG